MAVASHVDRGKGLKGSLSLSHYIFAFVFLVRALALARLTGSGLLLANSGDMRFYNDWAQRIVHGQFTDHLAFFGLPLYAYLLALFYKLFGYAPFVPGLTQAAVEAGTATFIYKIGRRVFQNNDLEADAETASFATRNSGKIVGAIAALGWAFFVPSQAYSITLMPTAWFIFVFWGLVYRLVSRGSKLTAAESGILGALVGITATGIATILFIVPLILVKISVSSHAKTSARWHPRIAAAALLFAGIGVGTSPCWIHNCFVARDPVFLSAHGGINFWLGNNPQANGYPRFTAGLHAEQTAMMQDSTDLAEATTRRSMTRSEVSAYWSAKARSYIVGYPREWFKLLVRKTLNFWNAFQYDDLSIIENMREQGITLPGPRFGIVAALALAGAALALKTRPRSRWIAAAILLLMAAVLMVFVTERYRLAAVPGLLLFAAFGLRSFWVDIAGAHYRAAVIYLALVAVSTLFVSIPRKDPSLWALDAYNSGWQALEAKNLPLAEKKLQLAYAYVPSNAETNFALGNLRVEEGRNTDAAAFYHVALMLDPAHKGALNNLGVLALDGNDPRAAADYFRRALKHAPRSAKTHYLLAKALLAAGDRDGARAEAARAVELDPNQKEFQTLRDELSKGEHDRAL